MWVGIKYMMSTANERANLKGTFAMYLIGVVMILLCSTIAKSVADVASSVGDNTAVGVVDKGLGFMGLNSGDLTAEVVNEYGDEHRMEYIDNPDLDLTTPKMMRMANSILVPKGCNYKIKDNGDGTYTLYPQATYEGKKFLYWEAVAFSWSDAEQVSAITRKDAIWKVDSLDSVFYTIYAVYDGMQDVPNWEEHGLREFEYDESDLND